MRPRICPNAKRPSEFLIFPALNLYVSRPGSLKFLRIWSLPKTRTRPDSSMLLPRHLPSLPLRRNCGQATLLVPALCYELRVCLLLPMSTKLFLIERFLLCRGSCRLCLPQEPRIQGAWLCVPRGVAQHGDRCWFCKISTRVLDAFWTEGV